MNIRELQKTAYRIADEKGWHDDEDRTTFGDRIALVHSEASEALEAFRDSGSFAEVVREDGKPEGVPSELADIVIRVAHLSEIHGIDLQASIERKLAFNATRPYRHGGKHL